MNKFVRYNFVAGLCYQIVYAISGFIVPRIIIVYFGSEMNGLVVSLTKVLDFFSVVEGGMTTVISSLLYEPLKEKDTRKTNAIISSAKKFYTELSILFLVYSFFVLLFYPKVIETSFDIRTIISLIFILLAIPLISYLYCSTFKTLLVANQKSYIVDILKTITAIINILLVFYITIKYENIVYTKLASILAFLIQPIIINIYVKRNYKIKNEEYNLELEKKRWHGFSHNLAVYIHYTADSLVLSIMSSLKNVSIYSIYEMICLSLADFVKSVSNTIIPTLGNLMVKEEKEKVQEYFFDYLFVNSFISIIIFTTSTVMIKSFVAIYTKDISDINYVIPYFGSLFMMNGFFECLKSPYVELAFIKGHFKETKKYAYIECFGNLILNVIFIKCFSLYGIIIATFLSTFIRTILQIQYVSRHILCCKSAKCMQELVRSMLLVVIEVLFISFLIKFNITSLFDWIKKGFLVLFISTLITVFSKILFERKRVNRVIHFMKGEANE